MPDSFYLNTSNCEPDEGNFSLLSTIKVTPQKKSNHLLPIILGTVGGLLLLALIVLAAVCVVIRKKKKKMADQASIYIPKGNIFMPDGNFPKSRAKNESHIYTDIEDTMVYGHLLRDPAYSGPVTDNYGSPQVDLYRPYDGNPLSPAGMERAPASRPDEDAYRPFLDPSQGVGPPRPHTPVGRQGSLGFVDRRMEGNEFNTFRGNGDLTPLRLSTLEPETQPEPAVDGVAEDSM